MSIRSRTTSGRRGLRSVFALAGIAWLAVGCNYGFQGGGGFPSHIRTL
jgi:hypothetical protein